MKITYYTAATLEQELRELERLYRMSSEAFYASYRARALPAEISGREAFRWAETYGEFCRMRARQSGRTEPQPA